MKIDKPIIISQIVNYYLGWKKEHPFWNLLAKVALVLIIFTAVFLTIPQVVNNIRNIIDPKKIYLNIWEYGKKMPLNKNGIVVPPINEIKKDEPTTLRFTLTQGNVNSPQITKIFITFPLDADVRPISYEGWNWEKTNSAEKNQYSLDYPTQPPAKGTDYNLPAFNVTFKTIGWLPFEYSIIGNKIDPITRAFTIDAMSTYQKWQSTTSDNVTSGITVRLGGNTSNTATPSVISPDTSIIHE